MKEHPEVFEEIDHKVREHFGLIDEASLPEKSSKNSQTKDEVAESELVSLDLDTIEIED